MSWRETAALIIRARREGVTLKARADGKLGWKTDRPLSDELLAVLKKHKYDLLALIRAPSRISIAVGAARLMLWRVRAKGFEVTLNDAGALLISDTTGRNRSLALRLPIAEVFDTIVAGLADDPDLLDFDTATAEPDLSDLDHEQDLSEPELFEPAPPLGLADDPGLLAALNQRDAERREGRCPLCEAVLQSTGDEMPNALKTGVNDADG